VRIGELVSTPATRAMTAVAAPADPNAQLYDDGSAVPATRT
jgi:hypothetical protein